LNLGSTGGAKRIGRAADDPVRKLDAAEGEASEGHEF